MSHAWTLSTSFEHFDAVRSRRHFGGSAISEDGETVVVALWEDEILRDGSDSSRVTYESRCGPTLKGKTDRVSLQWKSHLKWAMAHCNGFVRVVVLRAADTRARPRVMESCYPDDGLILRITHFDAATGSFQARSP
ncbi:MAG: hypothetical protein WBB34_18620 [Xanthobacteraceae bacterium]